MLKNIILLLLFLMIMMSFYYSFGRYQESLSEVWVQSSGVYQVRQTNKGYLSAGDLMKRFRGEAKTPETYSSKLWIRTYDAQFMPMDGQDLHLNLADLKSKDDETKIGHLFIGKQYALIQAYPRARVFRLKDGKQVNFFQNDYFEMDGCFFDSLTDSIGLIIKKDTGFYFQQVFLNTELPAKTYLIEKLHAQCEYQLLDDKGDQFLLRVLDRGQSGNTTESLYYRVSIKGDQLQYLRLPIDLERLGSLRPKFIGEDMIVYSDTSKMNQFSYCVYYPDRLLITATNDIRIPDIDQYGNQYFFDAEKQCFYFVVSEKNGRLIYRFDLFDTTAAMVSEYNLR